MAQPTHPPVTPSDPVRSAVHENRRHGFLARRPTIVACLMIVCLVPSVGCKRSPRVVPVAGKVLYNGKPLPFGSVTFQPTKGQSAVADLAQDGSFTLSSYGLNDGAVPGRHLVSVVCYENMRPGKQRQGDSLGKLLIPLKYTRLGSSGLTADIQDASTGAPQEVVLELSGPEFK